MTSLRCNYAVTSDISIGYLHLLSIVLHSKRTISILFLCEEVLHIYDKFTRVINNHFLLTAIVKIAYYIHGLF